jgi:hypothetical protein
MRSGTTAATVVETRAEKVGVAFGDAVEVDGGFCVGDGSVRSATGCAARAAWRIAAGDALPVSIDGAIRVASLRAGDRVGRIDRIWGRAIRNWLFGHRDSPGMARLNDGRGHAASRVIVSARCGIGRFDADSHSAIAVMTKFPRLNADQRRSPVAATCNWSPTAVTNLRRLL